MAITVLDLEQAHKNLVEMYTEYENSYSEYLDTNKIIADAIRDSLIKRFEYNYELSRKLLKQCLLKDGIINANTGLEKVLQTGEEYGYIEHSGQWYSYNPLRNATSHEYGSKNAEKTILFIQEFIDNEKIFLKALSRIGD